MILISGRQMRAGRALIRWSAEDLAKAAKVGVATVRRAESTDGEVPITGANCDAIRLALELSGVEFTDGDRPGVRIGTKL